MDEGKKLGSFTAIVEHRGASHYPIYVVTNGNVYINFYYPKMKLPFYNEDLRRELLQRINEVPGINISQENIAKGPPIPIETLENRDALEKLLSALIWAVQQIKSACGDRVAERIDQLLNEILKFRSDRDWEKFHTPRNLAISISLEAAELLENFQWQVAKCRLHLKLWKEPPRRWQIFSFICYRCLMI